MTAELVLDEAKVPAENLVGEVCEPPSCHYIPH